jgi:hypothetical protein
MTDEATIDVEGVSKTFGTTVALNFFVTGHRADLA